MIKFNEVEQEWMLFRDELHWDTHYPKPVYGKYIPQPSDRPTEYPCYAKEAAFRYESNGPDEYIMAFIYGAIEVEDDSAAE